jgi:hypothetical protein
MSGSKWVGSAFGAALLGLLVYFFVAIDGPQVLLNSVAPSARYSEVKIDLTLDGERIEMKAIARCRKTKDLDVPLVTSLGSGYVLEGGALAKRLPDGRGLVVIPRTFCSEFQNLGGQIDVWQPLPRGEQGLHLLLLDNADAPRTIGYPILPSYLKSPHPRISVHGLEYRERVGVDPTDPSLEVGWLRWPNVSADDQGAWRRVAPADNWIGQFASIVRPSDWEKEKSLADALKERSKPSADIYAEIGEDIDLEGLPPFEEQEQTNVDVADGIVRLSTSTEPWWIELRRGDLVPYEVIPRRCRTGIRRFSRLVPPHALEVDGYLVAPAIQSVTGPAFDPRSGLLIEVGNACVTSNRILSR